MSNRSRSSPPARRNAAKNWAGRSTSGSKSPVSRSCPPEKPRLPFATIYPSSGGRSRCRPRTGSTGPLTYHAAELQKNSSRHEKACAKGLGPLSQGRQERKGRTAIPFDRGRPVTRCGSRPVGRRRDQPLDPPLRAPFPCPLRRDHVGRRPARRQLLLEADEVRPLVLAALVERLLAPQPLAGDREQLARVLEHRHAPAARGEGGADDLAVEGGRILERPALDEVVGGLEAIGVVEDALHQRGQRKQPLARLAVGGAQLDVALEAHLGEER